MSSSTDLWEKAGLAALAAGLLIWTVAGGYGGTTLALVVASLVQSGACWWSSRQLVGTRDTRIFVALGASLGWFAEQMGSSRGWFFGSYTYTDVLGPRLGDVPLVIPLMWFGVCHIGFVLGHLLLWRRPAPAVAFGWKHMALAALISSMLITAFDLGADPYFVYQLKAWIMTEKDGDWFGETVRGFEGWMIVSFTIVMLFQAIARPTLRASPDAVGRRAAWVPIAIYAFMMLFQIAIVLPVALKVIAFFAMGTPLLVASVACVHWTRSAGDSAA